MVHATGWGRRCFGQLIIGVALFATACSRGEARFDVANARAHVNMLAGTIGSRVVGSEAGAKARNYLIDQLRLYGFDVRVQETDAARPELATTAHVANVIAFKAGGRREAIGLIAHYDSVAHGPGASDDGLGTAVVLEAARVLGAREPRNYSVLVILTDGEEAGLMGATAAVTDPEIVQRLKAYLNVESIGSAGPTVMFESGPDAMLAMPLLKAWARGAPHPRGSSYSSEIYKRLPNDTDFTIFNRLNVPGLNFASVGDSYAYHTARDTPERLTDDVLRQTGETIVGTAIAIDTGGLPEWQYSSRIPGNASSTEPSAPAPSTTRVAAAAAALTPPPALSPPARYFDVASQFAIVLGPTTGRLVTIVAILIALFAWFRLLRAFLQAGFLRVFVSIIWMVIAVGASCLAVATAAWLLRHGRQVFHPWYAHPDRYLLLLVLSGVTVWWYATRLMYLLPERGRSLRAPAAIWVVAFPLWIGLAGFMEYQAPAAALLWSVPLLAAGVLLAIVPPRSPFLIRLASVFIAIVACALWVRDGHDLFVFLVSVFARMPFVEPFWVFPAFVILIAIVVAPPLLAILTGTLRGRLAQGVASSLLLVALATSMGLAYFAEAYSTARPQRRAARYLADVTPKKAWWEIGGNEPGLDLNVTPAEAPRWRPDPEHFPPKTSVPLPPFHVPYGFRAEADAIDPPADVSLSTITRGDTTEVDVTIVPKMESLSAVFLLPPGIEPTQTNLVGLRPSADPTISWRARFVGIPSTGIAFRATVPTSLADRLAETAVLLTGSRLPGADQPRWPMWLPQDRAVWAMSTQWIIHPPVRASVEPVPSAPAPAAPLPGAALPSPTLPPPTSMPPR